MTKGQACAAILDDVIEAYKKRAEKFSGMARFAHAENKHITKSYCDGRLHQIQEIVNTLTVAAHGIRTGKC